MKAVSLFLCIVLVTVGFTGAFTLPASANQDQLDPLLVDPNVSFNTDGASIPADLEKDFKALNPDTKGSRKPASAPVVLDRLLTSPGLKLTEASKTLPKDLTKDFKVLGPEDDTERAPASAKSRSTARGKKPTGKPKGSPASGRQSRLPMTVLDGIEMRIRYAGLVSTFWIAKRGERYDLVFANNQGSRASVGLTDAQFRALHNGTLDTPAVSSSLAKCPNASIQMFVVSSRQAERVLTSCADAKGKAAEGLRNLANIFAAMVR